jgi:hypothetical protein
LRGWRYKEDDNAAIEQYIRDVQSFVNEYFFGNVRCPSNWVFPLNKEKTGMGDIKLANWHARKFNENLDLLVNIAIPADKEN